MTVRISPTVLLMIISLFFAVATHAHPRSQIYVGYSVLLQIPDDTTAGFVGRAILMETYPEATLDFKVALTAEPVAVEVERGGYSCSLDVFLGDVRVWTSGHLSPFVTAEECVVVLSQDGDLSLVGPRNHTGWRTGTSGQGVKALRLLKNGNLVLLDELNRIKWQSFDSPTDVCLWGQKIGAGSRLTSFPSNSTAFFYSLEVQSDGVVLFLNSGDAKYSYWDFKPNSSDAISFVKMDPRGLDFYDRTRRRVARIGPTMTRQRRVPLRFMALNRETGNLGLYLYSPERNGFEATFQALKTTCDLPLACKNLFGVCTFAGDCSCIRLAAPPDRTVPDCGGGVYGCGGSRSKAEMLELRGVGSVLRSTGGARSVNVSKEACSKLCLDDCRCIAAMYYSSAGIGGLRECFRYGSVVGVRQVREGTGLGYLVKVPKGSTGGYYHKKASAGLKKWVLVLAVGVDGLVAVLVLGGIAYYLTKKRKERDFQASATSCGQNT